MNTKVMRYIVLLLFLVVISAMFFRVTGTFIVPAVTAAIFATLFNPLYLRLLRRLGGRETPAALITVLVFFFVLVIPAVSLLGMVASQLIQWITRLASNFDEVEQIFLGWFDYLKQIPLPEWLDLSKFQFETRIGELLQSTANFLTEGIRDISMSAFQATFTLFIILFSMYYFLKDGGGFIRKLKYLSPLDDSYEDRLLDRFTYTARATIKGTFVLGMVQGVAGMVAFLVFGVEGALFWGVIMMFFSLIPAVGTGLVWVPAGLFKLASGNYVQGIGILVFGFLVISNIDNFLRPRLVGRDARIHPLLILLSTLGGISVFGILGIILGPVIAALFVTIWSIYGEEFESELTSASLGERGVESTNEEDEGGVDSG